jgi:predicted phosphoribosyltransferase
MIRFPDRRAAGRALVGKLLDRTAPPSVVLGVPRGGVIAAAPIASALAAPLAPVWVRKLVSPREADVVFGAVDLDGDVTIAVETVRAEGLSDEEVAEIAFLGHEALRDEWAANPGLDATSLLPGTTAIIVDDNVCTGLTLRAAMRWARRQGARRVVLAVPIVDRRIWDRLGPDADERVAAEVREEGPIARSDAYEQYRRVTDEEMRDVLTTASQSRAPVEAGDGQEREHRRRRR